MGEDEDRRKLERRADCGLTDEQIEVIADRAYEKATERIYLEVGKGVVRAVLYIVGAAITALAAWLGLSEKIIPPH